MTPNSRCRSLLVYGEFAPGGKKHSLLEYLPGEWIEGRCNGTIIKKGILFGKKEYLFGGEGTIPVWCIHFADDPDVDSWTPEGEEWERVLWDRWEKLDEIFGEEMCRSSARWWTLNEPEKFYSINVYQSKALHPYAVSKYDSIHPDARSDVSKL